jgi:hypothetical protein
MMNDTVFQKMFSMAGISRAKLLESLREMGPPRKRGKELWRPDRPTTGYCYAVSEVVSYHLNKRGVAHKAYYIDFGNGETHWFIRLGRDGSGEIIDLTADQIDAIFDYESGKPKGFHKNRYMKYGISKAAENLAGNMNLL